jgi:hypothetical protein
MLPEPAGPDRIGTLRVAHVSQRAGSGSILAPRSVGKIFHFRDSADVRLFTGELSEAVAAISGSADVIPDQEACSGHGEIVETPANRQADAIRRL